MTKQYNSEIEKELHLLRNSVGTINNKIDKIIATFDLLLAESIKRQEEVKKKEQYYEMQIKHSPYHISKAKEQLKKDGWEYTKEVKKK